MVDRPLHRPVVDPHKFTHTATALDPATNSDVGSLRIEVSIAGYRRLIGWAKAWPERTWAIENADGLGHHLALWLLALGEVVLDIPTTATARVRELSRGVRRKNDRIDAAAASVAALQGGARQVYRRPPRTLWRCSMSIESTCPTVEPERLTSCTRCCAS
jgi:transposase